MQCFSFLVSWLKKTYICETMVEKSENIEAVVEQVSDYELERGKPMPSKNHGIIQSNLIFSIRKSYDKLYRVISEVKVAGKITDVVPDLAIYPKSVEFTPMEDEIKMNTAPLAAIEILSPTQSLSELVTKSKQYFQLGTKSYWLVIPDLLAIHILSASGKHTVFVEEETLTDENLKITLDLKEVFDKTT